MAPTPNTLGLGTRSSRPISEMPRMVLMAAMASAPPFLANTAGSVMSVMLGVILAMTGIFTTFFTTSVKLSSRWKACPTLCPEPSMVMCGQEKFSSSMSAPLSSAALAR